MAPLKVRKPAAIMFDVVATTTKSFFIDQVIFPYIKKNAKSYLENNWSNEVLQHDVKLLREAAKKDKSSVQIADASADVETIQRTVCEYVSKALDERKDNEALTQFRFHIIFDGYAKDRIETPVYTDVAIQIHKWAVSDKIKLFVFSNGWKEATKRYLQKTNHGDMNLLIEDHFDTADGPLTDPATYKKVVDKVKQAPEDILFLTHSGKEGYAAKQAGLSVILMMTHRRDVNKLSEQEKKDLPYCRSFNEIIFAGDAPKARELDGSSVVEEAHKSSAGKASVTSTKSTGPKSAKSKKSQKPASSASSGSKTGAKKSDSKSKSSSATSTSGSKSSSASKSGGSSKTGSSTSKTGSKTGAKKSDSKSKSSSATSTSGSKSSSASKSGGSSKAGSKTASTEGGGSKSISSSKPGSSASGSSAVDKSASKSSKSSSKAGSKAGSSAGSKASSADGGGGSKPTDGSKAGTKTSSANDSKSTAGPQAGAPSVEVIYAEGTNTHAAVPLPPTDVLAEKLNKA